jgi:hypothetical protein
VGKYVRGFCDCIPRSRGALDVCVVNVYSTDTDKEELATSAVAADAEYSSSHFV